MTVNVDIHLKKDDSIEASVIRDDEGEEFITLQQHNLTFYFEGNGFECYRNACLALDRMKNAIQEAWNEKNNDRREDPDGNKRGSETGECFTAEG